MKKQGHPPYQDILFVDSSTGFEFVCGSTLQPKETKEYQGKQYPVCRVSVSSSSHPFFTKSNQLIDSEGRIDKFMKKYKKKEVVSEPSDATEVEAKSNASAKQASSKKASAKKTSTKEKK
jgi:large subunit ribosomal protein L31